MKISRHAYGPDPDQYVERYLPEGADFLGAVLVIHGGFWRPGYGAELGHDIAADLAQRGYLALNLEYRRADEDGYRVVFPDVLAGIDSLAGLGVRSEDVVAVGHSAGGQLAAYAAARLPLAGIVAQAGLMDLVSTASDEVGAPFVRKLLGGGPQDAPQRYRDADPLTHAPLHIPVVCVHSRTDVRVPFAQSQAYVAKGGDVELVEVPGDHLAHVQPGSPAWAAALDVLPRLFSRRS